MITATAVSTEEAVGVGLRLELDTGALPPHPTPAEPTGPEIATFGDIA